MTWLCDLGECYILVISILYTNISSMENISFLVCDGFSAFICSNETLPWDAVDGFSKERCSLRYFWILIQTQKVLIVNKMMNKSLINYFFLFWVLISMQFVNNRQRCPQQTPNSPGFWLLDLMRGTRITENGASPMSAIKHGLQISAMSLSPDNPPGPSFLIFSLAVASKLETLLPQLLGQARVSP